MRACSGQGLLPGTSLYAQYFRDVQNIVDAGDPLNFVTGGRAALYLLPADRGWRRHHPPALPDQVIPNSATREMRHHDNGLAGGLPFPRGCPARRSAAMAT